MDYKMLVWIIHFLFLLTPSFSGDYKVHFENAMDYEVGPVNEVSHISCTCDGRTERKDVAKNSIRQIFKDAWYNNYCKENDSSEICEMLDGCDNCTADMKICYPNHERNNEYLCSKRHLKISKESHKRIVAKGLSNRLQRNTRDLKPTCIFPKKLKTSDIFCTMYPSSINCTQKCVYGHTLKEGISRKMKCLHSENVWKPTGFEECLPFVDCTVELILPGNLKCKTVTSMKPPSCNLTCYDFEDKSNASESYMCTLTGWNKRLLFCAVSNPALELAPAPRVKLHPIETKKSIHQSKSNNTISDLSTKSDMRKSDMTKSDMRKSETTKLSTKSDLTMSNMTKKSELIKSDITNPIMSKKLDVIKPNIA